MKVILVITAFLLSGILSEECISYEDCSGFSKGDPVLCFDGLCRTNLPCNKDGDCGARGMGDMQYSLVIGEPMFALCMKVYPAPRFGYGECFLKLAINVTDENMWPSRLAGSNVMRAMRRV